jgi:hypothetical protein
MDSDRPLSFKLPSDPWKKSSNARQTVGGAGGLIAATDGAPFSTAAR